MVHHPASAGRNVTMEQGVSKGAPLLVTADLPGEIFKWADGLRRAHFPPERNKLKAHVTLFHALPPSVEDELRELLGGLARQAPPAARIKGLMKLDGGTALAVESPGMANLHAEIQHHMRGLTILKDSGPLRLHITIHNKVSAKEARALQAQLEAVLKPREFRFRGFELFAFREGFWQSIRAYPFRG